MATYNTGVLTIPVQPSPVELARLNVPLLGALPTWQVSDELLKWNVNVGGTGATGEAVTASVTDFDDDLVDLAQLTIGAYRIRSSFTVHEVKYTQALNRGVDELANLMNYSSMGARREILQKLGDAVINGAGNAASGGVIGLRSEAGTTTANAGTPGKQTTTNAYAGLNPTTAGYEKWTNLVYDNFGSLTKKKLRDFDADLMQGVTSGVPGMYNAIAMSPVTASKYLEVFDSETTVNTTVRGGADLGYGTMSYNGAPIIEDRGVADGEIHFVDTTALRLYSFNQAAGPGMSIEEPYQGLLLYAKQLPSDNPQLLKFAMFGMFQLEVRDRSAHAVIKGVTIS